MRLLATIAFIVMSVAAVANEAMPSIKHLVDIGGGRHLNIVCVGNGSPTVVFLQGSGASIIDWRKVRSPVAAFTRECFYDRANLGYSDPSDNQTTAENVVEDLHALMQTAKIKQPVVLVGHSLGGLYATLFADKYLSDVAGLVLVDPVFAGQFDVAINRQDSAALLAEDEQWAESMRSCQKLAQAGKLKGENRHICNMPARDDLRGYDLSPQEIEYVDTQLSQPPYYTNQLSEYENMAAKGGRAVAAESLDGAQEREHERSFGSIPLIVLTAGEMFNNPKVSEATNAAVRENWKSGHDKLAKRSTRGESIVVANSHHTIQLDQPDGVVEAIRKVVMQARQ